MSVDSFTPKGIMLRSVSVIIPYIRQDGMRRCKSAVFDSAGIPSGMIEVLAVEDVQRIGVPKMVARLTEISSFDLVCFLADDVVVQPDFLLNALIAMEKLPDQWGLVGLNDEHHGAEVATHWLAHKRLLPHLGGEFFHTGYLHCFCDNELTDRCREMGRYIMAEDAKITHLHPLLDQSVSVDSDYARVYSRQNFNRDHQLYLLRRENGWNGRLDSEAPLECPAADKEESSAGACSTSPITSDVEINYVEHIRSAWRGNLAITNLVDFAGQLEAAGELELAAVLYRTWLAYNNTPVNHLVYFNLGVALSALGNLDASKDAYLQAIALLPSFAPPHLNLGNVYERLGQLDAAMDQWAWVRDNCSTAEPDQNSWRQLALHNLERVTRQPSAK
jgi:hypothetical protein